MSPAGRTVIVVDQAITWGTQSPAPSSCCDRPARAASSWRPRWRPIRASARLAPLAERVVALRRVPDVGPLEQHYADWRQVTHDEALGYLEKARE